MSWVFLTPEQGEKIDAICQRYRSEISFLPDSCPDCPIREICKFIKLPDGTDPGTIQERGRIFEEALAKAAEKIVL